MGNCEYVLVKDVNNQFRVLTKNERCNNYRFSCVYSVTVIVGKLSIQITRGGYISEAGIHKNPPFYNQGNKIRLSIRRNAWIAYA